MLLDHPKRDLLVWAEHIDALSTDLLAGLGKRTLDDVLGDAFHRLFLGPSGGNVKRRLCHTGIAVDGTGDHLQLPLFQIPRDWLTFGDLSEDIDELVHGVLAEGNSFTPPNRLARRSSRPSSRSSFRFTISKRENWGRLMRS